MANQLSYREANPFYLVNVSCIGMTICQRFASLDAAIAGVTRYGEFVGVDGHAVLFSAPTYC